MTVAPWYVVPAGVLVPAPGLLSSAVTMPAGYGEDVVQDKKKYEKGRLLVSMEGAHASYQSGMLQTALWCCVTSKINFKEQKGVVTQAESVKPTTDK